MPWSDIPNALFGPPTPKEAAYLAASDRTSDRIDEQMSSLFDYLTNPRAILQQQLSQQQPPDLLHRALLTAMGFSWEPTSATAQYPYVPPGVTQVRPSESLTWSPPGSARAIPPTFGP